MCVLRKKIKNYEQGKYKTEKKMKAVAGVRDIGIVSNMETYLSPT